MRLAYLGDALDYWKGGLIRDLVSTGLLIEPRIEPLAADLAKWTPDDFRLYAGLLAVGQNSMVAHSESLATNRSEYLREIPVTGDIFLDPDTGVATGKVRYRSRYVFPAEICSMLDSSPKRVVAIYQHIRAIAARDRVSQIVAALQSCDGKIGVFAYFSGTVSMLFVSLHGIRLEQLRTFHYRKFGARGEGRCRLFTAKESYPEILPLETPVRPAPGGC